MEAQDNVLIVYTKIYPGKDIDQLIGLAHESGFEGYDLCLRPGFPINTDNVRQRLPDAHRRLQSEGLCLPLISSGMVGPKAMQAEMLLDAMNEADVRLLKLGYTTFDPLNQDYWTLVEETRREIAAWTPLAEKYGVKVCVHTHSTLLSCNCAALMNLLKDADPQWIGAYIDPAHMVIEGENFSKGAAMARSHLCAVGLKDAVIKRVPAEDHGSAVADLGVEAGQGMVNWTEVFSTLAAFGYTGPFSAHCTVLNYAKIPLEQQASYIRAECEFFKRKRAEFFGKREVLTHG